MPKAPQTFSKTERLSGRSTFDRLFRKGSSFNAQPFRVVWIVNANEQSFPARTAVGVPKRQFKRAVDRNLLKRRMREAYRRYKAEFYEELTARGANIHCLILYTAREPLDYAEIENKIIVTLRRLLKEYDAGRGRETKRD